MLRYLSQSARRLPSTTALTLAVILVAAIFLRQYNLDWYRGAFLHPDELHVANKITHQLGHSWSPNLRDLHTFGQSRHNPRSVEPETGKRHDFAYGDPTLFMTDLAGSNLARDTGDARRQFYGYNLKVGRAVSSLVDWILALPVFAVAHRIFTPKAGILAEALNATVATPIPTSHFFTTDSWLVFFPTTMLLIASRATVSGRPRWFASACLPFGLSMSSKTRVPFLALLIGVVLWTASFLSVDAAPNPRKEASRWIAQSTQYGRVLATISTDLRLPVAFAPGLTAGDRQFERASNDLSRDRPTASVAVLGVLDSVDSVDKSPECGLTAESRALVCYPVPSHYREILSEGSFGFELATLFRADGNIERPHFERLMAPAEQADYSQTRHAADDSLLLDEPVSELPVVADGRWSESLTGSTLPAVIVWIVLLVAIQFIGAPLAAYLFPRFPDLGWGLARLITVLLAGYLVWILASLELIRFRAIWCFATIALVACVAFLVSNRSQVGTSISARRRSFLAPEAVFWVVFAVFLAFRFVNPDSWHPLWGGEKPMEFAHLNAILRSAHFPPYDPWFSGGYINYYYYGSYLIAFLIKLTGIPSEIAFNLAQPTVIALVGSAAYSAASAISKDLGGKRTAVAGGVIGAFLFVGIGNLDAVVRFTQGLPEPATPDFFGWTWAASRAITGGITEFPYFTGLYADLHAHVVAWPVTILAIALCYSIAQQPRLLAVALSQSRNRSRAALAITARLGMFALVVGSLYATNAWDVPVYAALGVVSVFAATSSLRTLLLRLLVTLSTTFATSIVAVVLFLPFIMHYVTLFSSLEQTRSQTDPIEFAIHLGIFLAIIAVGMVVLSTEHQLKFRLFAAIDPIAVVILAAAALIATTTDVISVDVGVAAIVIVLTVLFAVSATNVALQVEPARSMFVTVGMVAALTTIVALFITDRQTLAIAIAFATMGACIWTFGRTIAARFIGALVAAGCFIVGGVEIVFVVDDLAPDPVWYRMNTIFKFYNEIWTLLGISASVLLVKMLSVGFGKPAPKKSAPVHIIEPAVMAEEHVSEPDDRVAVQGFEREVIALGRLVARRWSQTGVILGLILIAGGLFYPVLATVPRLELRFAGHPGIGTLNALDWMRYGTIDRPDRTGVIRFSDDLAAIEWFNGYVKGTPVIAEASIGPYRGNGSRISIATGLPTIIGWDRHERQQRYQSDVDPRFLDVRTLYDSASPQEKLDILREYDVEYVIVGDVEQYSAWGGEPYASAEGIAAFDELMGNGLEIAFQSGTTTVYRVTESIGAT